MTDSFKESCRDFSGCVRHAFVRVCMRVRVRTCVEIRRLSLRRYPVGTFPDGRTGEYRHIRRRFLHKIRRKTSGKFVSAVVTPSETALKSQWDFRQEFQERFREKTAADFQSAPQKTAEKNPEKIARTRTRTYSHACARKGKSRRDVRDTRKHASLFTYARDHIFITYART